MNRQRYAKLGAAEPQVKPLRCAQLRITRNFALDRIVHQGRLVEFNGASHRMEASLMLGKAEE